MHFEQVLVYHGPHMLQPFEIIRGEQRPAFQSLLHRPVSVANIGNLGAPSGVTQVIQQRIVGDVDIPFDPVRRDGFGRLKTNNVHHPAKRVEQALGITLDFHGTEH